VTSPIADSGSGGDYVELYAEGLWVATLAMAVLAAIVATLWVPSSQAARVVLGTVSGGVLGAVIMAVDKKGNVGPRLCGALVALVAATIHIMAITQIFDGIDVSPAYGVWVGIAGLVAIVVGCAIGTRSEQPPAAPAYGYGYR